MLSWARLEVVTVAWSELVTVALEVASGKVAIPTVQYCTVLNRIHYRGSDDHFHDFKFSSAMLSSDVLRHEKNGIRRATSTGTKKAVRFLTCEADL
jgi:hypothetical protein